MARSSPARVDLWYEDFLNGLYGLTPEERGIYLTVCLLIWNHKGRLPDQDQAIARACNSSVRAFRAVKAKLIAYGKLYVAGGLLHQDRAESEWELAVNRFETAKLKGAKGAEKKTQIEAKPLAGNDTGFSSADGSRPPSGFPRLHQHLEDKKDSPPSEGAAAPVASPALAGEPPELMKVMWQIGVALLGKKGRPLIGRWVKDYGKGAVFEVLADCQREQPVDPTSWMAAALQTRAGTRANDRSGMASYHRVQAVRARTGFGDPYACPDPEQEAARQQRVRMIEEMTHADEEALH